MCYQTCKVAYRADWYIFLRSGRYKEWRKRKLSYKNSQELQTNVLTKSDTGGEPYYDSDYPLFLIINPQDKNRHNGPQEAPLSAKAIAGIYEA